MGKTSEQLLTEAFRVNSGRAAKEGEDLAGTALRVLKQQASDLSAAAKASETAGQRAEQDRGKIEQLTADLQSAKTTGEGDHEGRVKAEKEVDRLTQEVANLKASVSAHKGQTTRARTEIQRLVANREQPARAAGPIRVDAELTADAKRDRLQAALADGGATLVFSDGKREIRELGGLSIDGSNLVERPGRGLVFDHEPLLEPGEMGKPEVSVAGFAVLDADGQQVAWSGLPEPVSVPRGGRVLIPANSIAF